MSYKTGKLRLRIEETAAGITHTIETEPVPEGERWYIERIALTNENTTNSDCEVSIRQRAYNHVVHSFVNISKGEYSAQRICVWLYQGEKLRFNWDDVNLNDWLAMYVTGIVRYES